MAQEQDQQTPQAPSAGQTQSEPRQSLRDIAEAAWDDVQDEADAAETGGDEQQPEAGQQGRNRDSLGRFAPTDQAAKPGEAAPPEDGTQPRDKNSAPEQEPPHPAPPGSSSEAPANWSAEDRQTFAKLPEEAKTFLLRRHSEMEGDYQRRVQANATAAQFTQALAPVFQDPVIAGSLQQANASPYDAIRQWASFHRRAMDPDPQVRLQLFRELGQRMGLDPAAVGMSQPGLTGQLSEADLKDPAIRYFADHLGKTFNDVQALRGELHQMRQQEAQRANAEVMKVTRWGIDQFADEKDAQGNLKHPHFDAVLPHLIELYRANPERSLQEAYDMAVWAVPSIRSQLIAAERSSVQQKQANDRAKQAVRSNARGMTSPVARPAGEGKVSGLRATLEASADEAGF
jgi:hypothetical protein